ncbi:MAG: hypothetical protein AAGK78_13685, partial [Planctomycetota bacterium]
MRFGAHANGEPANGTDTDVAYPPLKAGLNLWIEYSNETWNGGFDAFAYTQAKATELGLPNRSQAHGQLSRDVFQTVERAMGGRDRLVRVVAGQAVNPWHLRQALLQLPDRGSVGGPDVLSSTSYFGKKRGEGNLTSTVQWINDALDPSNPDDTLTPAEQAGAFALVDESIDYYGDKWRETGDLAKDEGLLYVAYESNQHMEASSVPGSVQHPNLPDVLADLMRDDRMRDRYVAAKDAFVDAGGRTINLFSDVGAWSKFGQWGHLEYQNQPTDEATLYAGAMEHIRGQYDQNNLPAGTVVTLENNQHRGQYLRARSGGSVDMTANASAPATRWIVRDEDGFRLESVRFPGKFLDIDF